MVIRCGDWDAAGCYLVACRSMQVYNLAALRNGLCLFFVGSYGVSVGFLEEPGLMKRRDNS